MKIHDLVQGSPEWHAHRATHDNASDAPAMMGCSPYQTRGQLLHQRHTGVRSDVTPELQKRFDDGHAYEALARPLAEQVLGADLFPIVGSEGRLSASFDGLTIDDGIVWEHKSLNDELRACMPAGPGIADGVVLPMVYRVQNEQQLGVVRTASRLLFTASKWNGDQLVEIRHCWYLPDLKLRAEIVGGWEQFHADLAAYAPPTAAAPAPVGKAPQGLPALRIEVQGRVTASNLAEFKSTALAAIRGVNRELKTDEDFANAEKAIKWCEDVEERLAAAKAHALSQTADIDALFRTVDEISAEARDVRLALGKGVKSKKESIRGEIVAGGLKAFADHLRAMNCPYLPQIHSDFAGVIKNKRTVASLQEAVDVELARVKIEANHWFQLITQNQATLAQHQEHAALFADVAVLVLKEPDDLAAVIENRIAAHRQRQEEEARAEAKARAALAAAATPPAPAPVVAAPAAQAHPSEPDRGPNWPFPQQAAPAPKADEPATLNVGAICDRLGFIVNAALLGNTLKITGTPGPRGATLYTESQFASICFELQRHIERVRLDHREAVEA